MRIAWFTENYPPNTGGMSRSCDRIVANLRQYYAVDVFHFTNKFPAFKTQTHEKGTYTSVPIFQDTSHTLNMLWAYIKDNSLINSSDAFVSFGSHLCLKGITLMANWMQKPILICFRGNDFDTAIFSQKKQDLLYSISNASAVACVTKEKQQRIQRMALNNHVYYTPNSIDFNEWTILKSDIALAETLNTQLELPKHTKIIGLIGFLKQKKGVDFFINTLKKSQLVSRVHLHIVGEIEPHIESELERLAFSYSKVSPISKTELIANYLICDCIAIPSIYDGMPNVIFEAAALNKPILASKAGGLPDVLNTNTAFLFDVLSEQSLLSALANFDNASVQYLQQTSQLLLEEIRTHFTTTHETDNYLNVLNTITT